MPDDKSLFHYGAMYHLLLDPLIKPARNVIVENVPPSSKVLDVGCGTGQLCFELSRRKQCEVTGIDLSRRMLDYAQKHNQYDNVDFRHEDATDMAGIDRDSYDYVVISHMIHELYRDSQLKLIDEAARVGRHLLLLDSNVPLPLNLPGIVKRILEYAFGFDHYVQFQAYLAAGGMSGILDDAQLTTGIVHERVFSSNCLLVVIVAVSP